MYTLVFQFFMVTIEQCSMSKSIKQTMTSLFSFLILCPLSKTKSGISTSASLKRSRTWFNTSFASSFVFLVKPFILRHKLPPYRSCSSHFFFRSYSFERFRFLTCFWSIAEVIFNSSIFLMVSVLIFSFFSEQFFYFILHFFNQ